MSTNVGGVNFDLMQGLPQLLKQETDAWRVPGLDGYAAQTTGAGDAAFEIVTVAYVADSGTADTLIDACNALQGTVVAFEDDWGDTYTASLVLHVDTSGPKSKMPVIKGGSPQVRVMVRWSMLAVSF